MPSIPLTPVSRGFTGFNLLGSSPDGQVAYASAPISDNGQCVASFTPDVDGSYALTIGVSTEPDYDFARGYIRDYSGANPVTLKQLFSFSGEKVEHLTVELPAGYSLDIEYTRDASDGAGQNSVFVGVSFTPQALVTDFDQTSHLPEDTRYLPFAAGHFAPDGSSGFKAENFTDEVSGAMASFWAPRPGIAVIRWRLDTTNPALYGFGLSVPGAGTSIEATANAGWATVELNVSYLQRLDFTFWSNGYIYPPWEGHSAQFSIHMKADAVVTAPVYLAVKALVTLSCAAAALSGVKVPVPISSASTIRLDVLSPRLLAIRALQGAAALAVQGAHRAPHAPPGLNGLMRLIKDPDRPDVVLDQYLDVWFFGDPDQCQVALQVDDHAEIIPPRVWTNPGEYSPAIVRLDSAAIPDDHQTHRLTIAVWQLVGELSSPHATKVLLAKTASTRSAESPAWCGAELIRQATATLGELSKVSWRHDGAVQIVAKYRQQNPDVPSVFVDKVATIGYGAHDQSTCYVDDVALMIGYSRGQTRPVTFGVAALHNGQFGPVTWALQPLMVVGRAEPDEVIAPSPDAATRTTLDEWDLIAAVESALRAQMATPPANLGNIVMYTYRKLRDRVKGIVAKGGRVDLQDFGTFAASWNSAQTVRGIGFTPSPGFKAGTRAGRVMTDHEAKVA